MKATLYLSIILLAVGFAGGAEIFYNLHEGWNMLAMPLEMDMRDIGDSLPIDAPATYYSPDSGYSVAIGSSSPCRGFWAMSHSDTACRVVGECYDHSVELSLSRGWNLIAMPDYRPDEAISSLLPIIPPAYLYDANSGDYGAITNFPPPNAGFWVLCDSDFSTTIDYDTAGFSIIGLDSVARDIELKIYSDGWGDLLDSCILSTEKDTSFNIYEEWPYGMGLCGDYYIYARAEGFYTGLFCVDIDETVFIDLDPIPPLANSIALEFIGRQVYFADHYVMQDNPVNLYQDSVLILSTVTDSMGRVFSAGLPTGDYVVEIPYLDPYYGSYGWPDTVTHNFYFEITNTIGYDFYECIFNDPLVLAAPYIYLYPETTSVVDVSLEFHNPGHVTASEPPYGEGWHVQVEPSGLIDGEFGYLFYEADYSSEMQITHAWTVRADTLEAAFRNLLAQYGCVGREIDDFVDFWMPYFADYDYYLIYPQDESAMVGLEISPEPDNILRIYFAIRGFDSAIILEEPAPPPSFTREGFFAVEWGVTTDAAEVEHRRERR